MIEFDIRFTINEIDRGLAENISSTCGHSYDFKGVALHVLLARLDGTQWGSATGMVSPENTEYQEPSPSRWRHTNHDEWTPSVKAPISVPCYGDDGCSRGLRFPASRDGRNDSSSLATNRVHPPGRYRRSTGLPHPLSMDSCRWVCGGNRWL